MKLLLNAKFYSKESLANTVTVFEQEGVAKISITKEGDYYNIVFEDLDTSFNDDVLREFANFVLSEESISR